MSDVEYNPFEETLSPTPARLLPWTTVIAGSLVTVVPVGATLPLLPPFGLLMLLAWRMLAPLSLRIWAPALLGFFDDLVSGQPTGSAVLLWSGAFFLLDAIEQRTVARGFEHDWLVAAIAIALCLIAGRFVAVPFGAHVDTVLALQVVLSILAFPLCASLVGFLDRKRGRA